VSSDQGQWMAELLNDPTHRVQITGRGVGRWTGRIVEVGTHPAPYVVFDTDGAGTRAIFLGVGVTISGLRPPR